MKLLHNGVVLDDSKTLESYNIKDENIVIMMNSKPSIPQPKPTDNANKTENKNNKEKNQILLIK